jgi:diaminopimelate decarboxylase
MKMAGGPKQFGIDAERVPDVLAAIGREGSRVRGFPRLQRFAEPARRGALSTRSARRSTSLFVSLPRRRGPCSFLNMGGGFGVPYFPVTSRSTWPPIAENLRMLGEEARHRLPEGATLVIELGRYLVARRASMSPGSWTARNRADRCSW